MRSILVAQTPPQHRAAFKQSNFLNERLALFQMASVARAGMNSFFNHAFVWTET